MSVSVVVFHWKVQFILMSIFDGCRTINRSIHNIPPYVDVNLIVIYFCTDDEMRRTSLTHAKERTDRIFLCTAECAQAVGSPNRFETRFIFQTKNFAASAKLFRKYVRFYFGSYWVSCWSRRLNWITKKKWMTQINTYFTSLWPFICRGLVQFDCHHCQCLARALIASIYNSFYVH